MSIDWTERDRKPEGGTNGIKISEGDIREGLREEFGRDPTAAEVKDFETYLERDIGTWLNENFRSYTRKLSEEGKLE
jgi:hypothetical protein